MKQIYEPIGMRKTQLQNSQCNFLINIRQVCIMQTHIHHTIHSINYDQLFIDGLHIILGINICALFFSYTINFANVWYVFYGNVVYLVQLL